MVLYMDTQDTRLGVNNGIEVKIGLVWLGLLNPAGVD